jgi:hypothetical protein
MNDNIQLMLSSEDDSDANNKLSPNQKLTKSMVRIKTKLNQIIERKMTLDNEYFKRIEQNDQKKLILQMLK